MTVQAIHRVVYRGGKFRPGHFTWVIENGGEVVGYTAVSPVPGLDGIFSLEGAVIPSQQRQGVGSRLLVHTLRKAPGLGIRQLSYAVTDWDSPAAHFLRHHDFFIEHEEWLLLLPDLTGLPTAVPPHSCCVQTYPLQSDAMRQFRTLYNQSFGDFPWYQPYKKAEIKATLDKPTDILFLFKADQPIGFAWLQGAAQEAAQEAAIEPIGIVKEEQGKGYGRFLLLAALHELKQRGAAQAKIGVWRSNQTAVHLYQSLGFQHQKTITYLAFDVP